MSRFSRRTLLATLGTAGTIGPLAGCASSGSGDSTATYEGDVVAGAGGTYAFDPEAHTISAGDTVTWYFASTGHNVSAIPDHSGEVSIPDGAEPFASYGTDGSPGQTEPQGATYEHTFEVPGTYTYVCTPHVNLGMIAKVVVEE